MSGASIPAVERGELLPVEQDDVTLVVVDEADDAELVTAERDEVGEVILAQSLGGQFVGAEMIHRDR